MIIRRETAVIELVACVEHNKQSSELSEVWEYIEDKYPDHGVRITEALPIGGGQCLTFRIEKEDKLGE